MNQVKRIENDSDYTVVMAKIDSIMVKGSENVSKEELQKSGNWH